MCFLANFLEKIKNVAGWYDPRRTIIFILVLGISMTLIDILKITHLMCILLFKDLIEGYNWYQNLYKHNEKFALYFCRILIARQN